MDSIDESLLESDLATEFRNCENIIEDALKDRLGSSNSNERNVCINFLI